MMMRVCVIGAGRMGSLYGALIARAGYWVVLFDWWQAHIEAVRRNGLRLRGITGDFRVDVPATVEAQEVGLCDMAIILTNTNQTEAAAEVAERVLKPEGFALTLQNGVGNIEALSEVLGPHRVVGGLSYHSAALVEPGIVDHTHKGPTWIGEIDGSRSKRLQALEGLLHTSGFEPTIVPNIVEYIWDKFVHNCAYNALCAVSGLRVGEVVRAPAADELQTRIVEEALAVVRAMGIVLPDSDPLRHIKEFGRAKFNKPSMLQHLEEGRQTEIDSLNGAVVRHGRALGISTPYNDALTLMIKACEEHMHRLIHEPGIDYERLEREAKVA
jgi:2-dehydropantoate 2-reductase